VNSTLYVISILLLMLTLGLAACTGGTSQAAAPSAAYVGDPVAGERAFASACAACHGLKGEGVPGLSLNMTQSELVVTKTDQELLEFIKLGGVPGEPPVMLPKGGVATLTDQNLADIVAYIRLLQN
jgi:mono/diheme cytochrome c family protein